MVRGVGRPLRRRHAGDRHDRTDGQDLPGQLPHTEKLHVVERWKLADDMTLGLEVTVDDSDTFYQPWKATHRYRRIQWPATYEEVCAENNQHTFDYNLPVASKPD